MAEIEALGEFEKLMATFKERLAKQQERRQGGANEHWNPEAGHVWLELARAQWASNIWINPLPETRWQ